MKAIELQLQYGSVLCVGLPDRYLFIPTDSSKLPTLVWNVPKDCSVVGEVELPMSLVNAACSVARAVHDFNKEFERAEIGRRPRQVYPPGIRAYNFPSKYPPPRVARSVAKR